MKVYKGYVGVAEIDDEAGVIRGRVVNTRDTITFQGATVAEAVKEFHASVDIYLRFCEEQGIEPEKPFSGNFMVRTKPQIQSVLATAAASKGVSLNAYVNRVLAKEARRESQKLKQRSLRRTALQKSMNDPA